MIQKSPYSMLKLAFPILSLFALSTCDLMQEPQIPTWTNKIEFPLINRSVTLDDLKNEDNIMDQLYVGGTDTRSIYAYADTSVMDSQSVGDQLAFGDITESFSQTVNDVTVTGSTINQSSGFDPVGVDPIEKTIESELGIIELSDIPATPTDPYKLNEILPSINSISDGTSAVIDPGPMTPVEKPFEFTNFSSAVFTGGALDITIHNTMAIALGEPISIQLQDTNGVDLTASPVTWNTTIPTDSSSTESLPLDGVTLPGDIIILVTGSSVGSEGSSILIDSTSKNSSFTIDISGSDLLVSSATAKVPSQTIQETGNIPLADSENKIESALIKAGFLKIEVENKMAMASVMDLTISSLEISPGVAFTTSIDIPALQTVIDISDVANHSLEMSIDLQQVEFNYDINTIDTQDSLVTVVATDSVIVVISLYGEAAGEQIIFKSITGRIAAQSIDDAGDIEVSSDSKIRTADISSGSLTITIDNQVNQPGFTAGLPTIILTIPELEDENSNPLTGSVVLDPNLGVSEMDFDLSEYFLVFPDTTNQVLTYTTLITTPSGEADLGKYALEDSILVDIVVSDMEFSTVTGYFSQNAMVDSSEIVLDEGTKLRESIFETGDFVLTMTNQMGVVADIEFQIDEFIHRTTSQPLSMLFRLENVPEPQDTTIDLVDYKLVFDSAIPGVNQGINYVSTVSLPSDEEMTLTFGDSILIDVDITGLIMESVTGIIEPDTLAIEESEQSISMPDMVADLGFEQVNIDIDFNSTFDIPIKIVLDLVGRDSLGNNTPDPIHIEHNLAPGEDMVHIDAADLLNNHPDMIVSSGHAVVGDGIATSTIAKGQEMRPIMYINVPLSLIIDDPPLLDMDTSSIASPLPEDEWFSLEEFVLYADVLNLFEFGATVVVLASNDSLAFDSTAIADAIAPPSDTLLTLELLPLENSAPEYASDIKEIILSNDKIYLLEQKLFLKPEVQLLGRTDENGNSTPSRFFTTDSLTLRAWGRVSYTVHGEEF